MKKTTRILSLLLSIVMLLGILPVTSMAIETDSGNNIAGPIEEWNYVSSDETSEEMPMLFSTFSADTALLASTSPAASDVVNVTVTAIDHVTGEKVPVPGANVHLYVGPNWKKDAPTTTDNEGNVTIDLSDLTEEEKHKATISAETIVSRGKAIDGTGRDALYDMYYPTWNNPATGENEYYRYTMELHSEWIDRNGNWIGTSIPKTSATDKVDIVFAIDISGSMSDGIKSVKDNIASFSQKLIDAGLDVRFCFIGFSDITIDEQTRFFTRNGGDGTHWFGSMDAVAAILQEIKLENGGDYEETPIDALGMIADDQTMGWRSDAHRFAFLMTDAGYKTDNKQGYEDLDDITKTLAGLNIITSVITTSEEKETYKKLYESTEGIYADVDAPVFNTEMINLANNVTESVTRDVELTLSEPRMLVNLSACYFANDKKSLSQEYYNEVREMFDAYSKTLAQATDGHVYLDNIILLRTPNRSDFFSTSTDASKCDIKIITKKEDDGTWWFNIYTRSFANTTGFYLDNETSLTDKNWKDFFKNIKEEDTFVNRNTFLGIITGGTLQNKEDNIDNHYIYSETLTHETGHYVLGFFDEYVDSQKRSWDYDDPANGGKSPWPRPYEDYGLMDGIGVEISKSNIHYSYLNGDFDNSAESLHTKHSWFYKASCQDWLASLMTDSDEVNMRWGRDSIESELDYHQTGKYIGHYTKATKSDRLADYPYAGLSDSDYITPISFGGGGFRSGNLDLCSSTNLSNLHLSPVDFNEMKFSPSSLGCVELCGNPTNTEFVLTPEDGCSYSLFILKPGDTEYSEVPLILSGSSLMATLFVIPGDMAELRLVCVKDETEYYNTYYVDRSEATNTGYYYSSIDGCVMAYALADENTTYSFIADNTYYTNGEYHSVSQATRIATDNDVSIDSGEIYSVVGNLGFIDYSSITWFKFDGNIWKELTTDCSTEENMNIGARADIDGEGLYVLMAKKAKQSDVTKPENIEYTKSTKKDALVTLSFTDSNTSSKYYNVYYSSEQFTDKADVGVITRSYNAVNTNLALNLYERGRVVYVAIEIVLEDGSRSELSDIICIVAGDADSDCDGIPDWYCDEYQLWPPEEEEKDIANSDDDGDGLTNLLEYQGGSDPRNPNDPVHTTNIPVENVSLSPMEIELRTGDTKKISASIIPSNASNMNLIWNISNNDILSIVPNGLDANITALAKGTATVTVVTSDGGYVASCDVTVSNNFTIEFSTMGGESETEFGITDADGKLTSLPTPTRSGYTFDGWYTASKGGTKVTVSTVFTEDTTIFAHWIKKVHLVRPIIPATPQAPVSPVIPDVEEKDVLPFVDVSKTDSFYDDVVFVYNNDLMVGVSDTEFAPHTTLSRGMIVTILYRLEGEPAFMNDNIFSDVETGSWYEKAVIWANSKGIVLGYGNGKFGPNDSVTREQMATIMYRYAQYKGYDVTIDENTNFLSYGDVFDISEYAKSPLFWALENDLIDDEDGMLNPGENAIRAVIATFFHRFCETFGK